MGKCKLYYYLFTAEGRYSRAMISAIKKARYNFWADDGKGVSMTGGLRVIRRFERVNKTAFNPWNDTHLDTVSGWGWAEGLHRKTNPPKD